ncbi:HPr family phosphocarrier protein [Candidatus Aerophobetes bacterium]|nr:HPr family phosphocarrier protein [Candidatus Aerophobetes bacterium]
MRRAKSLGKVIPKEEFISRLGKVAHRFFALANFLLEKKELSQSYYSNLASEAHTLETFLDNYKARGNRFFAYFTELVACIRWIAYAAHTTRHIQNRFKGYGLEENDKFFLHIQSLVEFCDDSLRGLYEALRKEAISLGIKLSSGYMVEEEFLETEVQEYLVQDMDEVYYCLSEGERVTEITFAYVDLADRLSELLKIDEPTEDKIQEFTSSFHRIQSKYDSYIGGSEEEKKDKQLKTLRGYISICLHLLEVAFLILHFYERHIQAESLSEVKKKISQIVDLFKVKENVKMVSEYANDYVLEGKVLAKKLLREYADVTLAREKVIIPKGSILHLRPASALVEPVIQCTTPVLLEIDGKRVRANSVLEIIAAMGEVADKIEKSDVEMVLQGDRRVVKKMKDNFLSKILETRY